MITGLIAPLLTPFDDKLALDQQKFNALAKRLLDTGCSGLAPFGTTGEALSVSHSERKAALQGLVFLTILMTVGIQGLTAQPLAKFLGLLAEDENLNKSTDTSTVVTDPR